MNSKKTVLILSLVFVLLLGGAYALYNTLGSQVETDQLASQKPAEETGETSFSADGEQAEESEEIPMAPDFTVYDGGGNPVRLSDFVGKPVVVNFWASWCGPCASEMPDFDAAYAQYGEDIHFLMVNMTDGSSETVESAEAFIEENGYAFPVYFDTDYSAAIAYGVSAIPATYFIDGSGRPMAAGRGALDMEALERGISMIHPA